MDVRSLAFSTVFVAALGAACGDVPIDDERSDRRLFPPRGVIRGTVTYVGPRPCSRDGHIVGNAILFVFDRRNPPPPDGIATAPVNFVAVPGDVLFANEPRAEGSELDCPPESPEITVSAPFTIAPLSGGSYRIAAFYDRRGRFWPTFKFRNQPEAGDLAGGYLDVADAQRNAQDPNYRPRYLPVDVGIPRSTPSAAEIPDYVVDDDGFVVDNVAVVIASRIPYTRPYFHPENAQDIGAATQSDANPTGDSLAVPIVAMTQDTRILAPPVSPTPATLQAYQAAFRSLKLVWGLPVAEAGVATDDDQPFGLQLPALRPQGRGGLLVFSRGAAIPENPLVPALWPQVALVKLAADPYRVTDPQSLVVQGTPDETVITGKPPGPLVVLQGITLYEDSLGATIAGPVPQFPTLEALRDHVTVLLRPSVLCFDPKRVDLGGLLVTPHRTGPSADASEVGDRPIFDETAIRSQRLVRDLVEGCLPKGRYAISLVYPTGQAWTVPNEMGGCAPSEGDVFIGEVVSTCSAKPRPVLLSQGSRAVLEIVGPDSPEGEAWCRAHPVPRECGGP